MTTVNVHEAKTHLSRLLRRVADGEEVVIARAGKPVARLVRIDPKPKRRVLGAARGEVWVADDFDELPPDLLKLFYEGHPDDPLNK